MAEVKRAAVQGIFGYGSPSSVFERIAGKVQGGSKQAQAYYNRVLAKMPGAGQATATFPSPAGPMPVGVGVGVARKEPLGPGVPFRQHKMFSRRYNPLEPEDIVNLALKGRTGFTTQAEANAEAEAERQAAEKGETLYGQRAYGFEPETDLTLTTRQTFKGGTQDATGKWTGYTKGTFSDIQGYKQGKAHFTYRGGAGSGGSANLNIPYELWARGGEALAQEVQAEQLAKREMGFELDPAVRFIGEGENAVALYAAADRTGTIQGAETVREYINPTTFMQVKREFSAEDVQAVSGEKLYGIGKAWGEVQTKVFSKDFWQTMSIADAAAFGSTKGGQLLPSAEEGKTAQKLLDVNRIDSLKYLKDFRNSLNAGAKDLETDAFGDNKMRLALDEVIQKAESSGTLTWRDMRGLAGPERRTTSLGLSAFTKSDPFFGLYNAVTKLSNKQLGSLSAGFEAGGLKSGAETVAGVFSTGAEMLRQDRYNRAGNRDPFQDEFTKGIVNPKFQYMPGESELRQDLVFIMPQLKEQIREQERMDDVLTESLRKRQAEAGTVDSQRAAADEALMRTIFRANKSLFASRLLGRDETLLPQILTGNAKLREAMGQQQVAAGMAASPFGAMAMMQMYGSGASLG